MARPSSQVFADRIPKTSLLTFPSLRATGVTLSPALEAFIHFWVVRAVCRDMGSTALSRFVPALSATAASAACTVTPKTAIAASAARGCPRTAAHAWGRPVPAVVTASFACLPYTTGFLVPSTSRAACVTATDGRSGRSLGLSPTVFLHRNRCSPAARLSLRASLPAAGPFVPPTAAAAMSSATGGGAAPPLVPGGAPPESPPHPPLLRPSKLALGDPPKTFANLKEERAYKRYLSGEPPRAPRRGRGAHEGRGIQLPFAYWLVG